MEKEAEGMDKALKSHGQRKSLCPQLYNTLPTPSKRYLSHKLHNPDDDCFAMI
jgi:hypothetical protein